MSASTNGLSAFTPGPWYSLGQEVMLDRDGLEMTERVAHCDAGKAGRAAAKANARLIAAAPDLLAACKKALYDLKGREHDGYLRDAIKKACGESEQANSKEV